MKKTNGLNVIFSIALFFLVSNFTSCTKGMNAKESKLNSTQVNAPPPTTNNTGGVIQPVNEKTATVGLPILSQAYSTLTSELMLNTSTAKPSTASRDEFNRQYTNLSESGQFSTASSSYTVAFTTLAAQVCLDRINFENIAANANQKAFFNSINLAAAPASSLTDQNLQTVINRLARSIWQRDETESERSILIQAVKDSMTDDAQNNANKTQEAMLFICTAMTSSLRGIQL